VRVGVFQPGTGSGQVQDRAGLVSGPRERGSGGSTAPKRAESGLGRGRDRGSVVD
jgi:hypothetical protein